MASPDSPAPDVRFWTGIAAFAVAILLLAEFLTTQITGVRPDFEDEEAIVGWMTGVHYSVLFTVFIDTFLMAAIIVFLAGFRQIISMARAELHWIVDIAMGAGIAFISITLAGDAMEAGAALDTVNADGDASVIRALTEGHAIMFGATGCVLLALISFAAGYAIHLSGAFPRWAGNFSYVVGFANLFGVWTMFTGTSDSDFFSAGGDFVTLFATFPWMAWMIVVGVTAITRARRERRASATT